MLPSRSGILAEAINTKILSENHPDFPHSHPDSPHSHRDSPIPTPIPRIHNLIPPIPTLIPRIPTLIFRILTLTPRVPPPDSPRSQPDSPRSHPYPHSVPLFPIPAFTDSHICEYLNMFLCKKICKWLTCDIENQLNSVKRHSQNLNYICK